MCGILEKWREFSLRFGGFDRSDYQVGTIKRASEISHSLVILRRFL